MQPDLARFVPCQAGLRMRPMVSMTSRKMPAPIARLTYQQRDHMEPA